MPTYLLELYVATADEDELSEVVARARLAAESLTREGTTVRHLQSVFVPADETCFCLYEAASATSVAQASKRAALATGRVVEARLLEEPDAHSRREEPTSEERRC